MRDILSKSYCQLKILLGTRIPGYPTISRSASDCSVSNSLSKCAEATVGEKYFFIESMVKNFKVVLKAVRVNQDLAVILPGSEVLGRVGDGSDSWQQKM